MINYYFQVLKEYFVFEGRIRRAKYWNFFLLNTIISIILSIAQTVTGSMPVLAASVIYSLLLIIPTIAAAIRRMHDIGKSGWWIWVPIYSLFLLARDSQIGENKYGPNPKGIGNSGDNL